MTKWLVTTAIAVAVAASGLLSWVWSIAGEAADVKSRVAAVEKRQVEDRQEIKERVQRTEERLEKVDANVNTILRKLDVIEERSRPRPR